nr:MAG TPA: hypothetical protein [Caudoviricetes sp.]
MSYLVFCHIGIVVSSIPVSVTSFTYLSPILVKPNFPNLFMPLTPPLLNSPYVLK